MLCLCRALLVAGAVSCTLSRIHANGPSTQRLDRIKDLMCVLLLSGMQKDDLDANMLNKLQRHNVNIHDLNNTDLLEGCKTIQYFNKEIVTAKINTNETKNSSNNLTANTKDADINYNLTDNNVKNYDNSTKNKNKKDEIKYVDGQPELKSVLNFWKDIKIDNSSKITEPTIKLDVANDVINKVYRSEQKNKRNVPEASNSNESDAIQKLLLKYLLKNHNKELNKPVKKNNIEIGDYNSDYFMGIRNDKRLNTDNYNTARITPDEMSPLNVKVMPLKRYALMNDPVKDNWQLKIPEVNTDRENTRPMNSNNFNDMLSALQSFYPTETKYKNVGNFNDDNKEIEHLYFNNFSERGKSFATEKAIRPKLRGENLSQNIIKEIANSVKELVLNDLRKEIFQTTASYSTTEKSYSTKLYTTEKKNVAPAVITEGQHVEQSILNKFMDLFEEIKTLNHKTVIISSENKKGNIFKEETVQNTYPGVVLPIINNEMINTQSNYKTEQIFNSKAQKIFNFSPQLHKYRLNAESTRPPEKRAVPITFQTNNMEIPPIGIPVSKPENPISQNIIVSTMIPYRIGQYGIDYEKKTVDSRITNDYIPKKAEIRFLKSQEPILYDTNHQNDNRHIINERYNYNSNLDDRVMSNTYKQPVHSGSGVKRGNIPRFHEKLERERAYYHNPKQNEFTNRIDCCDERYAYSKQMVDCCNRKIASRQQMSLNRVKKHPAYDDTHFNNFLKSQKKVTDMLERILASRGRVAVRSVETA